MNQQLKNEILQLKAQKNAVILAHYYAPAEVQELADRVGDSFYLAKAARASNAALIVLCGVSFMGESVALLCPDKKVLMPDPTADCAMAHMVKEGKIAEMREKYSDLAVVCYINSTAALKAQSDVCVTSSNAVAVVRALPQKNVFFIPDRNLGRYVAEQLPEKNIMLNDGCCPIHARLRAADVLAEREKHPSALVLAHPECSSEVLALSDVIGSTAEIIAFARQSDADEFIVCTEQGVAYRLACDSPNKSFYFPEALCCADMKRNTLQALLDVLKEEKGSVHVDAALREKALSPLDKMLEIAK